MMSIWIVPVLAIVILGTLGLSQDSPWALMPSAFAPGDKVLSLEVEHTSTPGEIKVSDKDGNIILTVLLGDPIIVDQTDFDKNKFDSKIFFTADSTGITQEIHTSCSKLLSIGQTFGDYTIVDLLTEGGNDSCGEDKVPKEPKTFESECAKKLDKDKLNFDGLLCEAIINIQIMLDMIKADILQLRIDLDNIETSPGEQGDDGISCWDLNANGVGDSPDEDLNGDNVVDVKDCKGSKGDKGDKGDTGSPGDGGTGPVFTDQICNPESFMIGINSDGTIICIEHLDFVVANFNDNDVTIVIGNGGGFLSGKIDLQVGNGPRFVAVGDFNGDTDLDLVVANQDDGDVSILLSTGTGSFGAKNDFGVGAQPFSIAVGDFNDDTFLDLAVANRSNNDVSILLGNGDGTFGAKNDFGVGAGPFSVAVGDFNGDTDLDLAVANFIAGDVTILFGTGTGSFGDRVDLQVGTGPVSVAVGDFNGDTDLDLVVANRGDDDVSILLGNGDGTFGAKNDFGVGDFPVSVAVGDFDEDTSLDLAVANFDDDDVSILLGNGDGTFAAKNDKFVGSDPRSIAVGDFDEDTTLDLAVALFGDGEVSILLGNGDGTFARTDLPVGNGPSSVAFGDFN